MQQVLAAVLAFTEQLFDGDLVLPAVVQIEDHAIQMLETVLPVQRNIGPSFLPDGEARSPAAFGECVSR